MIGILLIWATILPIAFWDRERGYKPWHKIRNYWRSIP